jgi:hypothetical protein
MCLPKTSDQPAAASGSHARSILGLGALMLAACLGGPIIASAVGALGVGLLAGAGGAILAVALCFAVPAAALARRRPSSRARP